MKTERRDRELWRDGDWRCEWWTINDQHEIRLFLGPYRVSVLPNGPGVDLWQQVDVWRAAASADTRR
jgi:hypothetical protein